MLSISFLAFTSALEPVPITPDTETADALPLPVVPSDILALQCPVALGIDLLPAANIRLVLLSGDFQLGWTIEQDNLLPVSINTTDRRLMLNAVQRQPFPDVVAAGRYRLGLAWADDIRAVSTPIEVFATPPALTEVLRYRNFQPGVFFDYSQALVFNQVRLPMRVDRPQYRLTEIPNYNPNTGLNTPLLNRIDKLYGFETGYLSAAQLEALQIGLRHDVLEFFRPNDPANPAAGGAYDALFLQGEAPVDWADDAALPLGRMRGNLRQAEFGLLNGMFQIPILPT